jgi:hypothetical protein
METFTAEESGFAGSVLVRRMMHLGFGFDRFAAAS